MVASTLSILIDNARSQANTVRAKARSRWWPGNRLIADVQKNLLHFEHRHLDPLFNRVLDAWADTMGIGAKPDQQTLMMSLKGSALTPEERALNRGLYVAASSLGLVVVGSWLFPPLRLLSFLGLAYNSIAIYRSAYRDLVERRIVSMDVLTALINTAYLGSGLLLWGSIAQFSFFFSARLLVLIQDRFAKDMTDMFSVQSQQVWQVIDGRTVCVPLDSLQIGDRVAVEAGEVIPVDGCVEEGAALVDQQVLTGESTLTEKHAGDAVLALTLVISGKLLIRVEKSSHETRAAQVGHLLNEVIDHRTKLQLKTIQLTDRLVLPILALSGLSIPWIGFQSAAALLDVHPQRQLLNLSTLSNLSFLMYAARQKILIKDGRSLEMINGIDTIIFDKTGTLTQDQPQVVAVHVCDDSTVEELLFYAAAAEQHHQHPIARALRAEAMKYHLRLPELEETAYQLGFGLNVQIEGRKIEVGSARFVEQEGILLPPTMRQVQEVCTLNGHSLVFVAADHKIIGAVELQIHARTEAKEVIEALRRETQIENIIIISGDQVAPTATLAKSIGITDYVAEALPADKMALVAKLQAAGRKVCFIGDGINDAVALKQADLSISMHGATTAATETSHIVFLESNLQHLLSLFALAKEYEANQRNLTLAVLAPGIVGALGIFFLGFGLPQMTLLSLLDPVLGTGVAMQPWLRRRFLK